MKNCNKTLLRAAGVLMLVAFAIASYTSSVFAAKRVDVSATTSSIETRGEVSSPQPQKNTKRTLVGTVLDGSNDKMPMVGVGVTIEGSTVGTSTDINGRFEIHVTDKTKLEFTYLGYKTQVLTVGDLGVMEVVMYSDNTVLDDIVVVGAGTQKKVSVTGAISSVSGTTLRTPSSSLTNSFAGKLAGVVSMTSSGEPGSASQFYIRGISTFGGRTTPLILMDGVEISVGDLNNIPAESIEGFSILKDASATAIYGARGANGVMLVTTKSGTENTSTKINVSFEQSFQQPVNIVEFADGATYMETYNEALLARTPGSQPRYTQSQIDYTRSGVNPYLYPDVDWLNLMFKDMSNSQRANINVTGGGSRVTYYMSLQANHDTGIMDVPKAYSFNNNHNRWHYTFQNNIGYKLTSTTTVDLRMNAQITSQKSPNTSTYDIFRDVFYNTPVSFPAIFPAEEGDSHLKFGSAMMSAGRFYDNPYSTMLNSFKQFNANKLNVSLNINQKFDFITKGLSATALVNFNSYSEKYYTRSLTPFYYGIEPGSYTEDDPTQYAITQLRKGSDYVSQSDVTRWSDQTFYMDARLNYDRKFGKHSVTGMLMYMMREYSSSVLPNRNQGFSGRFTYDYDNRYLAEFNFGYNGTERLAPGERFEFFPAVSLGWVVSNESFWKKASDYVDYFKIRSSYGIVGSDETGTNGAHFLYITTVSMNGAHNFVSGYGSNTYSTTGPYISSYAVDGASWERSTQFDVGVDLRFFNQVNVTFDYYHNIRDRILMKRASFPDVLGYEHAVPWGNVGKVDNEGVEFSVNWAKQLTKDWFVDIRGNFTYARNKYVNVDEPIYPYVWQTQTGKPLSRMTGYISKGLFADEEDIENSPDQSLFGSKVMPGDIKYSDVNGDGSITSEDQVMLSPYGTVPRIQYGFGASFRWKNLDFSVFFNGSAKRKIMVNSGIAIDPFCANDTNDHNLMRWIADGHWSEGADNSNAVYPRLGYLDTQLTNNRQSSDFWMRSGNFLRFKTLEIGYSLPHCRIYVSGDNLFVFSPFKEWDPELTATTYPLQRTFNLGVQLTF